MKFATKLALGAAGLGLVAGAPVVSATSGFDRDYDRGRHYELSIVGLTDDQRLASFTETRPWRTRNLGSITGLVDDASVVGIDYRPATGDLYALGDRGGVYTIGKGARATLRSRVNVPLRERPSASTSTPSSTACGSSATPARTCATTSTPTTTRWRTRR